MGSQPLTFKRHNVDSSCGSSVSSLNEVDNRTAGGSKTIESSQSEMQHRSSSILANTTKASVLVQDNNTNRRQQGQNVIAPSYGVIASNCAEQQEYPYSSNNRLNRLTARSTTASPSVVNVAPAVSQLDPRIAASQHKAILLPQQASPPATAVSNGKTILSSPVNSNNSSKRVPPCSPSNPMSSPRPLIPSLITTQNSTTITSTTLNNNYDDYQGNVVIGLTSPLHNYNNKQTTSHAPPYVSTMCQNTSTTTTTTTIPMSGNSRSTTPPTSTLNCPQQASSVVVCNQPALLSTSHHQGCCYITNANNNTNHLSEGGSSGSNFNLGHSGGMYYLPNTPGYSPYQWHTPVPAYNTMNQYQRGWRHSTNSMNTDAHHHTFRDNHRHHHHHHHQNNLRELSSSSSSSSSSSMERHATPLPPPPLLETCGTFPTTVAAAVAANADDDPCELSSITATMPACEHGGSTHDSSDLTTSHRIHTEEYEEDKEDIDTSHCSSTEQQLWQEVEPLAAESHFLSELLAGLRGQKPPSWDRGCGAFQAVFPEWYFDRLSSKALRDICLGSALPTSETFDDQGGPELIPCVFTWSHGGHVVYLVGSFTNWSTQKIRMARSGHEFTAIQKLPRGIHYYKFIVDDQWRFTPNQPTRTDSQGNVNNVLDISNYSFYNFSVPKEHERANEESYAQFVPGANDYTTDAPVIPILLSKSNCVAAEPQSRISAPLHVLSNHVYHDSHSASLFGPHITCVTSTQRWRHSHKSPLSTAGQRFSTVTYVTFNPLFPCHGDPIFEIQAAGPLRGIVGTRKLSARNPSPLIKTCNDTNSEMQTSTISQISGLLNTIGLPALQPSSSLQYNTKRDFC